MSIEYKLAISQYKLSFAVSKLEAQISSLFQNKPNCLSLGEKEALLVNDQCTVVLGIIE